ncbi:hypothetical protein FB561_1213 [Kribbella amoyensis]|uniref:Uncharacterized protein n=1 Tax=Kribbella amoyensis TaxID=996641 RepID=A0A561BMM6_9ACTN|nr:hypothetical protein FB561_1213 [Kribbella amoyensis]
MRCLIEACIVSSSISPGDTQTTSEDSELGVGTPSSSSAVKTIENSCRTSPSLVYSSTWFGLV